jgi:hypothetical protein
MSSKLPLGPTTEGAVVVGIVLTFLRRNGFVLDEPTIIGISLSLFAGEEYMIPRDDVSGLSFKVLPGDGRRLRHRELVIEFLDDKRRLPNLTDELNQLIRNGLAQVWETAEEGSPDPNQHSLY